jgi:hypothetical protein
MNFFGHAVVASWRSAHPAFVLGAMLPDFATMIRARPPSSSHREISLGIGFHHATDQVFHDAPTFRRLSARALTELDARGLSRGSARAVAHIGVEILLDGCLSSDRGARDAYLAALAAHDELDARIEWKRERSRGDLGDLVRALSARGVRREHQAPEIVAFRVSRALAPRPRLALDPQSAVEVRNWAEATAPEVARATDELVAEVRLGLSELLERD